jgi:hypothetical protein
VAAHAGELHAGGVESGDGLAPRDAELKGAALLARGGRLDGDRGSGAVAEDGDGEERGAGWARKGWCKQEVGAERGQPNISKQSDVCNIVIKR